MAHHSKVDRKSSLFTKPTSNKGYSLGARTTKRMKGTYVVSNFTDPLVVCIYISDVGSPGSWCLFHGWLQTHSLSPELYTVQFHNRALPTSFEGIVQFCRVSMCF